MVRANGLSKGRARGSEVKVQGVLPRFGRSASRQRELSNKHCYNVYCFIDLLKKSICWISKGIFMSFTFWVCF